MPNDTPVRTLGQALTGDGYGSGYPLPTALPSRPGYSENTIDSNRGSMEKTGTNSTTILHTANAGDHEIVCGGKAVLFECVHSTDEHGITPVGNSPQVWEISFDDLPGKIQFDTKSGFSLLSYGIGLSVSGTNTIATTQSGSLTGLTGLGTGTYNGTSEGFITPTDMELNGTFAASGVPIAQPKLFISGFPFQKIKLHPIINANLCLIRVVVFENPILIAATL